MEKNNNDVDTFENKDIDTSKNEKTFEFSTEELFRRFEIFFKEIEVFGKNFSYWEKKDFGNNNECENHLYKGYYMSVFGLTEYLYRLNYDLIQKECRNIGCILKEKFGRDNNHKKTDGASFFKSCLEFTLLTLHMSSHNDDVKVTKQILQEIFSKINVKKIKLSENTADDVFSIQQFQNMSFYQGIKDIRNGVAHGHFVHENCSVDTIIKITTLLAILVKNYFFLLDKNSNDELLNFFNELHKLENYF